MARCSPLSRTAATWCAGVFEGGEATVQAVQAPFISAEEIKSPPRSGVSDH
jgi:hypothetical protein